MATNGVVIHTSTILRADAFPDIADRVRKMGIEDHEPPPFKKANYFGGGLRCNYQPIVRA